MFKQIVHPIYWISQLNVLYRIVSKKPCPIHSPSEYHSEVFHNNTILPKLTKSDCSMALFFKCILFVQRNCRVEEIGQDRIHR